MSHPVHSSSFVARYQHSALKSRTRLELAAVHASALVQAEKLHAVDFLARQAMSGQAMLVKFEQVLAVGDPFVKDELRFFADIARLGKGEVIVQTVQQFNSDAWL